MNVDRPVSSRLIIFTKYPELGKAKTRLIPKLGAQGATDLHRQLAEHTLHQAREYCDRPHYNPACQLEIRFSGGDEAQMQTWLGDDRRYTPQGSGDLGDRMARAFQTAFDEGDRSVVIVGTDCPAVDANVFANAFFQLSQVDLVLGVAQDGGYYLIGLRQLFPELFQNIVWSTETVLQDTLRIAQTLGLTIALLPTLPDIDRPEDLQYLPPSLQPLVPTP